MSTNLSPKAVRAAAILMIAGGAIACSDATTAHGGRALSVSITTQAQSAVANRAPLADVTVAIGGNSLVITKAQLVARRIELAPVNASSCAGVAEAGDDDGSVQDGCAEVEVGPTLLDIPLDASTKTNITTSVPAGTYRGLEIRIDPISSGNRTSTAFLVAHPEFKNVSVRVEGTFNGKAFVFMAPVDARIETLFSAPVTVDANNPNVTIAVDIANWFSDGAGGTLDPTNGSNTSRISANIANSLHAFEDDDHDGHDDHSR